MKSFESWCKQKVKLNSTGHGYPKHREVWWASIGVNVGHEQDGVGDLFERPVLVIKRFANDTCLVIPMTKAGKDSKFYHKVSYITDVSYLVLSQVRTLSSKRLTRNIRRLDTNEFTEIMNKMKKINGIK